MRPMPALAPPSFARALACLARRWLPLVAALGLAACQAAPAAPKPAPAAPAAAAPTVAAAASAPTTAAPPGPPQPTKLTIAAKSLAFLPYFVGVDRGIFEAEGFRLELPIMASNLAVAALTAGEINYTASTGSSIQAAVTGSPLKVVMYMLKDLAFTLVAAPEITSPADLRGKSIAITNLTATDDYAWRAIVRAHGVPPDEVTAVGTGTTANSFAALTSGGVQAAVLSPPLDIQAQRQGYRGLAWAADYLKRAQSGLATTDRHIQERPDEIRRMIRATLRSMHYTLDNPADAVAVIEREFNVPPDLAPAAYEEIARVLGRDGEVAPEAIREEIEDTKERTGITADIPISQVADLSLLRQVRAELGLRP